MRKYLLNKYLKIFLNQKPYIFYNSLQANKFIVICYTILYL